MKSTASLIGMEYFSLLSIPSNKIAVAFHLMFLGNLSTALTQTGERTNRTTAIKRPAALLLKYLRDIIASSAEYLGRLRRAPGESYDRHPRGLSRIDNLPTEDCREVRACPQTHCPLASARKVKKVCLTPKTNILSNTDSLYAPVEARRCKISIPHSVGRLHLEIVVSGAQSV